MTEISKDYLKMAEKEVGENMVVGKKKRGRRATVRLEPTFWRTCRVLEGEKRLHCLRLVSKTPGLCVLEIAQRLGIRPDEASRSLRALQSRGLITGAPVKRNVRYSAVPNQQVRRAISLLSTMEKMLARAEMTEEEMHEQLSAFRHTRRLKIMTALAQGGMAGPELQWRTGISRVALYRHLALLCRLGHVTRKDNEDDEPVYQLSRPFHPLGRKLRSVWFQQ